MHAPNEADVDSYAIANHEGGVGRNPVTLALASELARRGTAVGIVELDPQASATKVVDVDVEEQLTASKRVSSPTRSGPPPRRRTSPIPESKRKLLRSPAGESRRDVAG